MRTCYSFYIFPFSVMQVVYHGLLFTGGRFKSFFPFTVVMWKLSNKSSNCIYLIHIQSFMPLNVLNYNPASYAKEKANSNLYISHSYSQRSLGFVSIIPYKNNFIFFFILKINGWHANFHNWWCVVHILL